MTERKQGDQTPRETSPSSADVAKENAPEPSDKASTTVQVMFPADEFVIEGVPVITSAGTPLTKSQTESVVKSAKENGVRLMVDGKVAE